MSIKDFLEKFGLIKNTTFIFEHGQEYYARIFFEQILPQIEQISNQSKYGYHGLTHTAQVAMFGLDIAYTVNQDPLPVLLAAGLHDCARTNDSWCTEHGPRAVPIAYDFLATNYPTLPKSDVKKIVNAVKNHTVGINARDNVSACLWDGDRIRLSWEHGYRPDLFSTMRGRQIAGFNYAGRLCYIETQNNFLIQHGIKTREQIDYERAQDKIYNKTGTDFKSKNR